MSCPIWRASDWFPDFIPDDYSRDESHCNARWWKSGLNSGLRTSLVAQWLRIRLPMQGTWVWSLVLEDPTWRGAAKPVCHNYWACALEPASHNYWAHIPQLLKPVCLEPVLRHKRSLCTATKSSPRSLQLEKARVQPWRPNAAKNKLIN